MYVQVKTTEARFYLGAGFNIFLAILLKNCDLEVQSAKSWSTSWLILILI